MGQLDGQKISAILSAPMRKNDLIEKKVAEVQDCIINCPNDEPMVEGETLWMTASGCSVQDLMYDCDVPENLHEAVCDRLHCPKCGATFDLGSEVGTKYDFEIEHEITVDKALRQHGKTLFDFYGFLHKFPMLGMAHPFGRRILRDLKKAQRTTLPEGRWFRAQRKKEYCNELAPWDKVADQRYNGSGHPLDYISDNAKCAMTELLSSGTDRSAWIQSFHLDQLEGVLDLRPWNAEDDRVLDGDGNYRPKHPLVLVALLYSDLLTLKPEREGEDVRCKPEYLVTRFVGEAARLVGFSAIIFPSVRYDGENLVLLDKDFRPKPDQEPQQETLTAEDLDYSRRTMYANSRRIVIANFDPAFPPEILAPGPV